MLDKAKSVLSQIPTVYTATLVLALTLAAGWGAHDWVGQQVALPQAIERNTANIAALEDQIDGRIDELTLTVETLVTSQRQLTARMETLVCLLDAQTRGMSVFGCPR